MNVEEQFTASASTYHSQAIVQKQIADLLFEKIQKYSNELPTNVQELGSGTGFLSHQIGEWMQEGVFVIQDLSLAMLMQNQMHFPATKVHTHFLEGDFRKKAWSKCSDWICSSSAIQWVEDFPVILASNYQTRISNCKYAFSTFSPHNFENLKFTFEQAFGQKFPETIQTHSLEFWEKHLEEMKVRILCLEEVKIQQEFSSLKDLLKSFPLTGTRSPNKTSMSLSGFKKWEALLKEKSHPITLDWVAQILIFE